ADQKSAGSDEGDDHAGDMALPDVAPDPKPARGNENGADCIEGCVNGGQVVYCHVERGRDISCGDDKRFLDFGRNDKSGQVARLKYRLIEQKYTHAATLGRATSRTARASVTTELCPAAGLLDHSLHSRFDHRRRDRRKLVLGPQRLRPAVAGPS